MADKSNKVRLPSLVAILKAALADVGRTFLISVVLLGFVPEACLRGSSWAIEGIVRNMTNPVVHAFIQRGGQAVFTALMATAQTGIALQLLKSDRVIWRPSAATLFRGSLVSVSLALVSAVAPALGALADRDSRVKLWAGLAQVSLGFYVACRLLLWVPVVLERDLPIGQALNVCLAHTRRRFWEIAWALLSMGAPLMVLSLLTMHHQLMGFVAWTLAMPVAMFFYCRICIALIELR